MRKHNFEYEIRKDKLNLYERSWIFHMQNSVSDKPSYQINGNNMNLDALYLVAQVPLKPKLEDTVKEVLKDYTNHFLKNHNHEDFIYSLKGMNVDASFEGIFSPRKTLRFK